MHIARPLAWLGVALPLLAQAAPKPAKPPADNRIDAFYIGHSLQSDIPDMVAAFCASREKEKGHPSFRFREQFIIGSTLENQWNQRDRAPKDRSPQEPQFMGYWFEEFPKGGLDALVLIDSVPRGKSGMAQSLEFASKLIGEALAKSPDVRVFFYEPWHCIYSGTPQGCPWDKDETSKVPWRERLDVDAPMWDGLLADLKKAQPKANLAMIPAGRSLGVLADAIAAGKVKGFAKYQDLFDDDIHLNPYGKYFVACLHYAALTGKSPEGLPFEIQDRWGRSFWDTPNWAKKQWSAPAKEAIAVMQQLAWACAQGKAPKQPAAK